MFQPSPFREPSGDAPFPRPLLILSEAPPIGELDRSGSHIQKAYALPLSLEERAALPKGTVTVVSTETISRAGEVTPVEVMQVTTDIGLSNIIGPWVEDEITRQNREWAYNQRLAVELALLLSSGEYIMLSDGSIVPAPPPPPVESHPIQQAEDAPVFQPGSVSQEQQNLSTGCDLFFDVVWDELTQNWVNATYHRNDSGGFDLIG